MTDTAQTLAELRDARARVLATITYCETASGATASALAEARASLVRIDNAIRMLESEPPPDPPKLRIENAEAKVPPGGVLRHPVALSAICAEAVKVSWSIAGRGWSGEVAWQAGDTALRKILNIQTKTGDAPGAYTITLHDPENATIEAGTAFGEIAAAEPLPDVDPTFPGAAAGKVLALYEAPAGGLGVLGPIDIPAGKLVGLRAILAVIKYTPDAKRQSFWGGASTANANGAFCFECRPDQVGNAWHYSEGGASNALTTSLPTVPQGRFFPIAIQYSDTLQIVTIDGEDAEGPLAGTPVPCDGPAAIGAKYWQGQKTTPLGPGSGVSAIVFLSDWLDREELDGVSTRWADRVDDAPPPPALPAMSIADAPSVVAGQDLVFRVSLSTASAGEVRATLGASHSVGGAGTSLAVVLAPGAVVRDVTIQTGAVGTVTATLTAPIGCTLGRATATGQVTPVVTPPGDGLEPVDSSAVQVQADVEGTPLATWKGFGVGGGGWSDGNASTWTAQVAKLKAAGCTVYRVWTAEQSAGCLKAYKPTWQMLVQNGFRYAIGSGFYWRSNASGNAISAAQFAAGVAATYSGGIPLIYYDAQNEPEGRTLNAMPSSQCVPVHRAIADELKRLGCPTTLAEPAWAHAGVTTAFDLLDPAGLVPGSVGAGGGHNYSDCGRPSAALDRWWKRGCGMIYSETGNLGLPHGIARSISSLTHNGIMEVVHIGVGSGDMSQVLVGSDGTLPPWYDQYMAVFALSRLPEGAVWRRVSSSDTWARCSGNDAKWMVRRPRSNPRLQMASGRRPDGKVYFAAVNTTSGAGQDNIYAGSCAPGTKMQVKVRWAELAGRNGSMVATRCGANGRLVAPREYPILAGETMLTLAPGELAVLVGG